MKHLSTAITVWALSLAGYMLYVNVTTPTLSQKIVATYKEIDTLKIQKGEAIARLSKATADLWLSVVVISKEIIITTSVSDKLSEADKKLQSLITLSDLNDKALREGAK